jgi:preprotein translocase subunit YajC
VQDIGALLPFVAIALLFWLLIIRPASKRQKAMAQMQSAVSVGDEVVLTSGVYGRVSGLEDSVLLLTVADGVTIKVARGAVGNVVPPEEEPTDAFATGEPLPAEPVQDETPNEGPVSDGPREN